MHVHTFLIQRTCVLVFALCALVCVHILTKKLLVAQDSMSLSFKFYKDPSFSYRDICKTMLLFVWSLIFYVLERMETLYQNVRVSVKIWHQF